jgi:hypothetical protein
VRALAFALVAFALSGPIASAEVPPVPSSPVTFTLCRPVEGKFNLITGPGAPSLEVEYRNTSGVPLDSVRVALVVDGSTARTFDDTGPFAAGTTVHRTFRLPIGFLPLAAPGSCAAATVRFADGTTWTNPQIGADVGAGLEQTPESRIRVEQCEPTRRGEFGYVTIAFVDTAPADVTRIAFTLLARGQRLQRFEKDGPFAAGSRVAISFGADQNIFPLRTLHPFCRVDEVAFADGTSWKNPLAPADPYAAPQDPAARVDVPRCSTVPESRFTISGTNSVFVDFVNRAPLVAKQVAFAFAVGGETVATETVSGTFSPNVTIKANVKLPTALIPLGTSLPACTVSRVVYEDGTSWALR